MMHRAINGLLQDRDLRSSAVESLQELALVGSPVRSAEARTDYADRAPSCFPRATGLGFAAASSTIAPSPISSSSSSIPRPASGPLVEAQRSEADRPRSNDLLHMEFADEGGGAATPYEVLLTAAATIGDGKR